MKVVLATDGSAGATRAARYLVKHLPFFGGKPQVTLVSVDAPIAGSIESAVGAAEVARLHERNGRAATRSAKRVLNHARLAFVERLLVGDPAETIARVARETRSDVVVMGSRGRGEVASALLGSVVNKLLAQSKTPVLVIAEARVQRGRRQMKVLIAVDGSAHSLRATRYVTKHLKSFGRRPQVTLLNVDLPMPKRIATLIGTEDAAAFHYERSRRARRRAAAVLNPAGVPFRERLLVGDIATTIAWAAKNERSDLLVMGSRGESALTRFILGSVLTKVLAQSTAPVLVVQ